MKITRPVITAVFLAVALSIILFVLFRTGVDTDFVYQKY